MSTFAIIFSLIHIVLAAYLYLRFVHRKVQSRRDRSWATAILALAFALTLATPMSYRLLEPPVRNPAVTVYYWFGYSLMGLMATIVLYSLVYDLFWAAPKAAARRLRGKSQNPARR